MKLGTVTAAAASLGSSQPTVTRDILRLESQLGFALFERSKQRLRPTERAKRLYAHIQTAFSVIEDLNHFVERLREGQEDRLIVATLPALALSLLPEVALGMKRQMPALTLEIQTVDPQDENPISGHNFDIGLIEGIYTSPAAQVTAVADFPLVVVMRDDHALAERALLTPTELEDQALVTLAPHDPSQVQLTRLLDAAGVQRRGAVSCQSAAGVCELVACGLGIAIVNPLTAMHFANRGLVLRSFQPRTNFSISAIRPVNRADDEISQSFLALLKETCRSRLIELGARGIQ
jgi:DNA-binding transcriptional LysR family regulator